LAYFLQTFGWALATYFEVIWRSGTSRWQQRFFILFNNFNLCGNRCGSLVTEPYTFGDLLTGFKIIDEMRMASGNLRASITFHCHAHSIRSLADGKLSLLIIKRKYS
jgi:hypothetical protein